MGKSMNIVNNDFDCEMFYALCDMIAKEILQRAVKIDEVSEEVQETYTVEWTAASCFAHEVANLSEEGKDEFADFMDESLELVASMELDRNRGVCGMYFLDDSKSIIFNVRRITTHR